MASGTPSCRVQAIASCQNSCAGGSPEIIEQAAEQSQGLGIFIRSLVGLDKETATQAFSQFVVGTTATASQLEFIDLIVQYLTENGVMNPARLYESPFTDIHSQGPDGVFESHKVEQLFQALYGFELQQAVA